MRKFLHSGFWFFISGFWFLVFGSPSPALAQTTKTWTGRCVAKTDVATIQGFECLFYNILQVIIAFAGLAFFIMLIVGGFNYLFSVGDEKKAAAASSTLTMAITGLIGIIASWFIIRLLENISGVSLTNFFIPGH